MGSPNRGGQDERDVLVLSAALLKAAVMFRTACLSIRSAALISIVSAASRKPAERHELTALTMLSAEYDVPTRQSKRSASRFRPSARWRATTPVSVHVSSAACAGCRSPSARGTGTLIRSCSTENSRRRT